MFTFLDPRVWLLALALAGVSGGLGYIKGRTDGHKLGAAEVQKRWDALEAKRSEIAEKARTDSLAAERRMQEKTNVAIATANQRAIRARADADLALGALERLRNAPLTPSIASGGGSTETTCAAADDRTRAVRDLLLACSTEYQELAGKADGHFRDALSVREAWPTGESK